MLCWKMLWKKLSRGRGRGSIGGVGGLQRNFMGLSEVTVEERLKREGVSKPQGHLEGRQSGHRKQLVQRS